MEQSLESSGLAPELPGFCGVFTGCVYRLCLPAVSTGCVWLRGFIQRPRASPCLRLSGIVPSASRGSPLTPDVPNRPPPGEAWSFRSLISVEELCGGFCDLFLIRCNLHTPSWGQAGRLQSVDLGRGTFLPQGPKGFLLSASVDWIVAFDLICIIFLHKNGPKS